MIRSILIAQFIWIASSAPQAWNFHLKDSAGNVHSVSDWQGKKAAVLLFIAPDCPISNRYAPEINRIVHDYSSRNVIFEIVYSDPGIAAKDAAKHIHDFGFQMTALLDPQQALASRTKATITPSVVVLSADGVVQYRGRIDDRYVDLVTYRDNPQRQDLRLALDSILSGKPVELAVTQAVGCYLPPPRKLGRGIDEVLMYR
jgi:hypothetical protein